MATAAPVSPYANLDFLRLHTQSDHFLKATLPAAARQPEREETRVASTSGRASWESALGFGFNPYSRVPQHQNLRLFEQLVDTIPVVNAALERIVQMVGCPKLASEDEAAQQEFEEWWMGLRVNRIQTGGDNWFAGWVMDHLTYGRSHAEILLNGTRTDVFGLQALHTRTVELRPKRTGYGVDLVQNLGVFGSEIALPPDLILTAVHDVRNDSPQGNSLLMGLPFVGEIYGKILVSTRNVWERFGAPVVHINYQPPEGATGLRDPSGTTGQTIANRAAAEYSHIEKERAQGRIAHLATSGNVTFEIVGAEGENLNLEVPEQVIIDQIIAKTGLPPMLLGVHRTTTERLSWVQAQLLSKLIHSVRGHLAGEILYLWKLRGALAGRPIPDAQMEWDAPSLIDEVEQAKADLSKAQADAAELKVLEREWTLGIRKAVEVARARRPELEGKTDEQVRTACPDLLDQPPVAMSPFGPGAPGEEEGGDSAAVNRGPFGRSLYSPKAFGGNGNGRH
jgi:hypothetical protein